MEVIQDADEVPNWLARLDSAIAIELFNASSNLPTVAAEALVQKDKLKQQYLLASLGRAAYGVVKSFCAPATPETKSYDDLVKLLKDKLAPAKNVISEQYRFNGIKQELSESLAVYLARVREAAASCEFGDQYSNMVRNRFICGVKSDKIRSSLLSDTASDASVDAVYLKAIAKEQAAQSNSMMNAGNVNQLYRPTSQGKTMKPGFSNAKKPSGGDLQYRQADKKDGSCSRCTLRGHSAEQCRTRCRYCKEKFHIVRSCPKLQGKMRAHQIDGGEYENHEYLQELLGDMNLDINSEGLDSSKNSSFVNLDSTSECNSSEILNSRNRDCEINENSINNSSIYSLLNLGKPFVTVQICGKSIEMEFDTGSTVSCISSIDFEKLQLTDCKIEPCGDSLRVANGQQVSASRIATVDVRFKGNAFTLPLHVIDGRFPTLLGRTWIRAMMGEDWLSKNGGIDGTSGPITQGVH